MSTKCRTIYRKFTNEKDKKNYKEMCDLFIELTKSNEKQLELRIWEHICRVVLISCKTEYSNAPKKYIVSVVNEYEQLFDSIANTKTFKEFFVAIDTLNQDFDSCYSLFCSVEPGIPVRKWLHSFSDHIRAADERRIKNNENVDDVKKTFLILTRFLLVIFCIECSIEKCAWQQNFNETCYFLDVCRSLKFIDDQCIIYIEIVKRFLMTWRIDYTKWSNEIGVVTKMLGHSLQKLRSTYVQDIHVTISRLLSLNQESYLQSFGSQPTLAFQNLIRQLNLVLSSSNYEKIFCSKCKTTGAHEMYNLLQFNTTIFKNAIEKSHANDEISEKFSQNFLNAIKTLSKLNCDRFPTIQTNLIWFIRSLMPKNGENTDSTIVKYQIEILKPIYQNLAENASKISLTKCSIEFNAAYIAYQFFEMVRAKQNFEQIILIGYWALKYFTGHDENELKKIHYIVYHVTLAQKEINEFKSPYDIYSSTMSTSNLINQMLMYLRFKSNTIPLKLSEKYVDQMLILGAKEKDKFDFLKVIYYVDEITDQQLAKFCNEIKRFQSIHLTDEDTMQLNAIKGLHSINQYKKIIEKLSEQHKSIAITEQLTSNPSFLSECNILIEQKYLNLLFNAKKSLEKFIDFYSKLTIDERQKFNSEIYVIQRSLKYIALKLQLHDCETDAMDVSLIEYKLAKIVNNQMQTIRACAYFAENAEHFRNHSQTKDLKINDILIECSKFIVQQLKMTKDLSVKHQQEMYNCLLSIAIFYVREGRINESRHFMVCVQKFLSEHSEHVEVLWMKYYYLMFIFVNNYRQSNVYSPMQLIDHVIEYTKKKAIIVQDSLQLRPLILFKLCFDAVEFYTNRYGDVKLTEVLLHSLLKINIRLGLNKRSCKVLYMLGVVKVNREKIDDAQKYITVSEFAISLHRNASNITTSHGQKTKQLLQIGPCADEIILDASHGANKQKFILSPKKVFTSNIEVTNFRYLHSHSVDCACENCQYPTTKIILLALSSLAARTTYLKNDNSQHLEAEFNEIYKYWTKLIEKCEKLLNFDDCKFLHQIGVRALIWNAHFEWKFSEDFTKAINLLNEANSFLRKIHGFDMALEHEIQMQLKTLHRKRSNMSPFDKLELNNYSSGFIAEPKVKAARKKAVTSIVTVKVTKPKIDIMADFTIPSGPSRRRFQIHDDGRDRTPLLSYKSTPCKQNGASKNDENGEAILISDSSDEDPNKSDKKITGSNVKKTKESLDSNTKATRSARSRRAFL